MYTNFLQLQGINNGTLTGKKAMPQKDLTSDGESSFEMGRHTYVKTLPKPGELSKHKKCYGNHDASQITANRRNTQIGLGSLNASGKPMSFTTFKDVNVVNDALARVRGGGAVAPAKKGANKNNAPTPTFLPARPKVYNSAMKYQTLFH
jgi:hypothetical protein